MPTRSDPSGTTGLLSALLAARHPGAVAGAATRATSGADETRAARRRPDLQPGALPPGRSRMKPPPLALAAITVAVLVLAFAAWQLSQRRPPPATAPRLAVEEVLYRVGARYRAVEHAAAALRLEVTNHDLGSTTRKEGRLYLQRAGKLRWDVLVPGDGSDGSDGSDGGGDRGERDEQRVERSFISDGAHLQLVDHRHREILKLHRAGDPLILATAFFTEPLLPEAYTAELAPPDRYLDGEQTAATLAVALSPRPGATSGATSGGTLVLLVDPADFRVREAIVESGANRYRFTFFGVDTETAPDARWFELDPQSPRLAGFRLVDAEL